MQIEFQKFFGCRKYYTLVFKSSGFPKIGQSTCDLEDDFPEADISFSILQTYSRI